MNVTAAQRIGTFVLALLLSVAAWVSVEGQELQVDPAVEAEWFRAWEMTENEVVWCGYGGRRDGTVVVSSHEQPEIKEATPVGITWEACFPYHEGQHLVATIHTHPSLTQLRERMGRSDQYVQIRAWRKRHYGTTEYECELSQTDRRTFSEASRFGEGNVQVSIVICAPDTYAYRMADNIYGGEPVVVERGEGN